MSFCLLVVIKIWNELKYFIYLSHLICRWRIRPRTEPWITPLLMDTGEDLHRASLEYTRCVQLEKYEVLLICKRFSRNHKIVVFLKRSGVCNQMRVYSRVRCALFQILDPNLTVNSLIVNNGQQSWSTIIFFWKPDSWVGKICRVGKIIRASRFRFLMKTIDLPNCEVCGFLCETSIDWNISDYDQKEERFYNK